MQGDRHRVWSMVVTIFGDLAQNQGDELSAQTLARLTEPMGIKSEALRVALHRLRKDGWIESKRIGRSRSYFLTPFGVQQSAEATPRIYGQTDPQSLEWVLATTPNQPAGITSDWAFLDDDRRFVRLGAHSFLGERSGFSKSHRLLITSVGQDALPEWVKETVIDPKLIVAYSALIKHLTQLKTNFPAHVTAMERSVLRTLIVHSWRRIVLRHLDVPVGFYPKDCQALRCRDLVLELLDRLPRPTLADLTSA